MAGRLRLRGGGYDWWYRYRYTGTSRDGTVWGTVGDLVLTVLPGSASSAADGSRYLWMP